MAATVNSSPAGDTPPSPSSAQDLWSEAIKLLRPEAQEELRLKQADKLVVLNEVLVNAQEKRQLCKDKQWRYTRSNGKTILFRDIFEKIVSCITKLKDIGDAAGQIDPLHIGLPWGVVKFLLQASTADYEAMGAVFDGIELIVSLIGKYAIFEEIYLQEKTPATDILRPAITKLYASILTFLAEAKNYYVQKTGIRIVKGVLNIGQRGMAKLGQNIQDDQVAVNEIARLVDAEYLRTKGQNSMNLPSDATLRNENLRKVIAQLETPIQQVNDQLGALVKDQERVKKFEILGWISKMPYNQHHETVRSGRLENSGLWLFDLPEYMNWRKSRQPSLLWLHGIPGSGKSKLVSLVVDTLRENGLNAQTEPLAYVYCTRSTSEPQRAESEHILRSILRQLACARPGLPIRKPVLQKWQDLQEEGFDLRQLTITEAKSLILELLDGSSTTVVIDALDECDSKSRFEILETLEELLSSTSSLVKILVSSRDPRILPRLKSYSVSCIDASHNTDDIKRFVEFEVTKSIDQGRLLGGSVSSELKSKIIATLKSGAQGMFLWVTLQIDSFCDPERFKLEEDVLAELGRLPRELAEVYSQIYNKVAGDRVGQHARRIAETALQWLLCAPNALSTSDFITAVYFRVTGGGKETVITKSAFQDICGNLLIVDEQLDVFRFFHLSVREFLQDRPDFAPTLTHATAAEICINTLLTREWLSDEVTWQKASLYQYVTLYWASHIERCAKDSLATGKIGAALESFFMSDNQVPSWFTKWLLQVDSASQTLGWDDPLKEKIENTLSDAPATFFFTACVFGLTDTVKALIQADGSLVHRENAKASTGLHLASQYGHVDIVKLLLQNETDINKKDGDDQSALICASLAGNQQIVELLLANGADARAEGKKHGSALQAASVRGHANIVKLLLNDAELDSGGGQFGTALQAASLRGHVDVVRILLDGGAAVNDLGGQYETSPQLTQTTGRPSQGISQVFKFLVEKQRSTDQAGVLSCGGVPSPARNFETLVQVLLDKRLDFNIQAAGFGTALQAASRGGHENVVRLLLDRGADVNAEGGAYGTALQAASVAGNITIVNLLLDKSADVNAEKGLYNTALQAACRFNHHLIVDILLEQKADTNAQGGVYGTALHAAVRSHSLALVSQILDRGGDPDALGGRYGTALQAASTDGLDEIIQLLLDRGANPDIEGGQFGTALQAACGNGHLCTVKVLLDKGAKVGRALNIASLAGHEDIVSLLLRKGADPNADQESFGTAVQMAVAGQRERVVQILLDQNADLNIRGEQFGTALQIAASRGNEKLVKLLLTKGADPGRMGGLSGTRAAWLLEEKTDNLDNCLSTYGDELSALEAAAQAGHTKIVETLLGVCPEVFLHTGRYNVSRVSGDEIKSRALSRASNSGHLSVVQLLISSGVDPNNRFSPLGLAAANGHEDVVLYLLECKAEINKNNKPPLLAAMKNNHESIVRLLVERGADVNKSNSSGSVLHVAAYRGLTSLAKLFLEKGAEVNSKRDVKCSAILLASFAGHIDIVEMLIRNNADVNIEEDGGWKYKDISDIGCPLHAAALQGHEDVTRILIRNGASVNKIKGRYSTPLLAASINGHENIVRVLIDEGADVRIPQKRFEFDTALQAAAYGGFENIVRLLLQNGAAVNRKGGEYGTAIQAAALCGHVGIVRLLIQWGANLKVQGGEPGKLVVYGDYKFNWSREPTPKPTAREPGVEYKSQNGRYGTALQAACVSGNVEVVRLLLANGADPNDKDEYGQTPLHRASYHGHRQVVDLLLEQGTNINIKDLLGRTALRWAASYGYSGLLTLLTHNGATIDEQDSKRQTALHRAAFNGHVSTVEFLLTRGANLESVDRNGETPLFAAAENGQLQAIKLLLARGARADHRDRIGATALHAAAGSGHHTLIRPLLDAGIQVNARTSSLKTPLHYATLNDRYEFTYLLLMNGACVDARDIYKMTPLHHAAGVGHSVVVRLLLDRKADLRAKNHEGKTPLRLSQDDFEKAHAATRVLCQREGISFAEAQKGRRWNAFSSDFSVDKRDCEKVYSMKELEVMLDIVAGVHPPRSFAFHAHDLSF